MRLPPGTRLGFYEILAPLGSGGMGEVYRARDTRLKRDVALKVLPGVWANDEERVGRFKREAEVLAAINHPGIAAIYGIEEADGLTALILELVDGETLGERLRRGPLPAREAISMAQQLVDALDAAHERGIVHRDLKPSNLTIRRDGTVKVLDFGIAKVLEPASMTAVLSAATVTAAATDGALIMGTPAYMSPEQARGQALDKRTDIWAFGCVLYEALSGRSGFARSTAADTMAAVLDRELDWSGLPPSTPPSLLRLLRRCVQKDRTRRLRDIADARSDLEEAQREADATAAPSRSAQPAWGRWLALTAVLASVAAMATVMWSGRSLKARSAHAGPAFRRVVADASFATEPAISRDGTFVAYASDRAGEGQLDLWLQRTSGGSPIRLTSDPADDREPDFSPDGSLIAFRSYAGRGGVFVIPPLGGNPRLVAEGGRTPRFSPDANRIAYWTGSWLGGPRTPGSMVFMVAATGGQPTRIAEGFSVARNPVWSPNGNALLFFGRRNADDKDSAEGFDWWRASLDGSPPVATGAYALMKAAGLSGSAENNTISPAPDALPVSWTRDGVLFSARLGESTNLWQLRIDAQSGTAVADSLERLTYGAGADLEPSVDDSGRIGFRVATESAVSLVLPLDPDAGRTRGAIVRHTAIAAGDETGRNSMDDSGRLLAYPRIRSNESEIWVKDLATREERQLVTTPRSQLNPILSHRGSTVAYTVAERGTVSGYVIPVAGGAARKVCDGCTLFGWLADDRRILTLNSSGVRVRLVDVDSGAAVDVLHDPSVGRVDVSPDERWLAFSSGGRLWNARFQPGKPIQDADRIPVIAKRPSEGSAERACGWSPDSHLLYLLLERDGFRDLYAQRIDATHGTPTGEAFIVQHLHDPRRRWGSTSYGSAIVSNAFVFNQVETTGSVWLLDPTRPRAR